MANNTGTRAPSSRKSGFAWAAVAVALVVALAIVGFGSLAGASVPAGSETSGNGSAWALTDSVRPGGPVANTPVYAPTTDLGAFGDDTTQAVPAGLPFAFALETDSFPAGTEVRVSSNGTLAFGTVFSSPFNDDLATTAFTQAIVAPFWDDLNPLNCSDGIFADTFGVAPNRVLVVEWRNVCPYTGSTGETDGFTFQARLFETTNVIEFHYSDVEGAQSFRDNGKSATVGIKAAGATAAYLQYSFETAVSATPIDSGGFAIRLYSLCDTATPAVATAAELDSAITCFNLQQPVGDHTITLGDDFSHPSSTPVITQSNVEIGLVIDGADHTITGPGSGGSDDLFTVQGSGSVEIKNVTLTGAGEEALTVAAGAVALTDATITSSESTGVVVSGGRLTVSGSTISTNAAGGIVGVSGSLAVSNSTIDGNTTSGIAAFGAAVHVSNSTITDNGTGLAESGSGVFVVTSSIVAGNTPDCSGSSSGAANFASDATCGPGFAILVPVAGSLGSLGDNGGPTETRPLLGSNALDAGDCTGVTIGVDSNGTFVDGDLQVDQRGTGFARTIGADCDAGAYENSTCAAATANPTVYSAGELDTAIVCYNQQQPVGDHVIAFGSEFAHLTGTPTITQDDANFDLTIDGATHTFSGPGRDSLAGENHLFTVSGAGPVFFAGVTLADADNSAIRADSGSTVSVTGSTLRTSLQGVEVSGGTVTVTDSTVIDNGGGLYVMTGSLVVANSTIIDNDVNGVAVTGGSVVVSNSTITENLVGIYDEGGSVQVSNSTIANNRAYGLSRLFGDLEVTSSIAAGNGTKDCDGSVVDGGNNLQGDGTCGFGFTYLLPTADYSLGPIANNGGPTRTQALLGSNAVDAGVCTSVPVGIESGSFVLGDLAFDQRGTGYPRFLGSSCDAGAFEAGDCGPSQFAVATGEQLAFAIGCFNVSSPNSTVGITLTTSFDVTSPVSISGPQGGVLTVSGNGNRITVPAAHEITQDVFTVNAGLVRFSNVEIDTGSNFLIAFSVYGGTVSFDDGAIATDHFGAYVVFGKFVFKGATLSSTGSGIRQIGGFVEVDGSSFVSDGSFGRALESYDGQMIVVNSTVAGFPNGLVVDGTPGDDSPQVTVSNSTFTLNGTGISRTNTDGVVNVVSSIVGGNTTDCSGLASASPSANFDSDGSCPSFAALSAGSLGSLTNGVVPLVAGSTAVDAGVCAGVARSFAANGSIVTGDLEFDQRGTGFPRTLGAGCDAGAFEAPAEFCDGKVVTIDMNINGGVGNGTAGNDVILGTPGPDVINGGTGDDTICGGAGNDNIQGAAGNDTIFGEAGDDKLFGAQGHDTIRGGDGDDTIHGNRGNDVLFGDAGADRIFGYAHDDTISGGDGNDRLHGNFGDDIIDGDAGDDRIFGYGDEDTLRGGAGKDLMTGNFGDDFLDGGADDDVLYGADGDDTVNGGPGNDVVNGNSLNDTLNGGAGNDTLDGGIDVDVCNGNSGTDTATRCETITGVP